jgi:hypothetical protein
LTLRIASARITALEPRSPLMPAPPDSVLGYAQPEFPRIDAAATIGQARGQLSPQGIGVVTFAGEELACVVSMQKLAAFADDTRLDSVLDDLAPVVVVPGDLSVSEALAYPALRYIDAEAPAVVVTDGARITGLWSGPTLLRASLIFGATRSSDTELPGRIDVPHIVRHCGFSEGGTKCGARQTFPERPDAMPSCANPLGLSSHSFVW